ncbi:unnamed protein product, partial [Prorocentrum cordatum]
MGDACPVSQISPRRSAAERRARREWARLSADRADHRLSEELHQLQAKYGELLQSFVALFGDPGLADRVLAVVPALTDLLQGRLPEQSVILRRNVAMHASAPPGLWISLASTRELRKLQKGARLPDKLAKAPDAAPCAPQATNVQQVEHLGGLGSWEPCGAAIYYRAEPGPHPTAGDRKADAAGGEANFQARQGVSQCADVAGAAPSEPGLSVAAVEVESEVSQEEASTNLRRTCAGGHELGGEEASDQEDAEIDPFRGATAYALTAKSCVAGLNTRDLAPAAGPARCRRPALAARAGPHGHARELPHMGAPGTGPGGAAEAARDCAGAPVEAGICTPANRMLDLFVVSNSLPLEVRKKNRKFQGYQDVTNSDLAVALLRRSLHRIIHLDYAASNLLASFASGHADRLHKQTAQLKIVNWDRWVPPGTLLMLPDVTLEVLCALTSAIDAQAEWPRVINKNAFYGLGGPVLAAVTGLIPSPLQDVDEVVWMRCFSFRVQLHTGAESVDARGAVSGHAVAQAVPIKGECTACLCSGSGGRSLLTPQVLCRGTVAVMKQWGKLRFGTSAQRTIEAQPARYALETHVGNLRGIQAVHVENVGRTIAMDDLNFVLHEADGITSFISIGWSWLGFKAVQKESDVNRHLWDLRVRPEVKMALVSPELDNGLQRLAIQTSRFFVRNLDDAIAIAGRVDVRAFCESDHIFHFGPVLAHAGSGAQAADNEENGVVERLRLSNPKAIPAKVTLSVKAKEEADASAKDKGKKGASTEESPFE